MRTARATLVVMTCVSVQCAGQSSKTPDLSKRVQEKLSKRMSVLYGTSSPPPISFDSPAGKQPHDPSNVDAIRGDIAAGVILLEQGGVVYLDSRPCSGHVITFVKPYIKLKAGSVTCGGHNLPRFQLEEERHP